MRVIAVGLAAIPLALLLTHHSSAPARPVGHVDLRLSRIASEIARRDVEVHCRPTLGRLVGARGEAGSVGFDGRGRPDDFAELTDGICRTLHTYSRNLKRGDACVLPCDTAAFDVAWSMNALAHESYHLAGVRAEAPAECYAIQAVPFVARRLGASDVQSRALAGVAATRVLSAMPDEYASRECRDGGTLDLRPANPDWP